MTHRTDQHRHSQRGRRASWVRERGPKPVRVEYPDCGKADFYTLAEYRRRKAEFDADACVFIDGVQQARQEVLC
jgi:hypothetical protein